MDVSDNTKIINESEKHLMNFDEEFNKIFNNF